jgi:hypothetical protein
MAERTTRTTSRTTTSGTADPGVDALLRTGRFFTRRELSDDLRAEFLRDGREGDVVDCDRWSHDKVVRSTHGVNCTGSCSWINLLHWDGTGRPTGLFPPPKQVPPEPGDITGHSRPEPAPTLEDKQ